MAFQITVGNTVIEFPESAQEPNWAEGIIAFANAVAENLNSVVGRGDVLPNVFTIDALNGASLTDIPGFTFDTTIVRGSIITYAVLRQRDATTMVEEGIMQVVYNPDGATNEKWTITRDYTGESLVGFGITDDGQVQISTEAISGSGSHTGTLSYKAVSALGS